MWLSKVILKFHGIYKPTGLNRTYPNVVNYESVFGMEEMKWSEVEKNIEKFWFATAFLVLCG